MSLTSLAKLWGAAMVYPCDRNRGVGNSLSEIQTPHFGSQGAEGGGKPRLSKTNNRGREHLFSVKSKHHTILNY